MEHLTPEQLAGVQGVCSALVEARTQLEKLNLVSDAAARIWGEISNAHAHCSCMVRDARLQERMMRRVEAG